MASRVGRYELILIGLLFLCTIINYMDRVNISITAPLMVKDYGWDSKDLGFVFSSFFWGYFLLQIPMGWLADKLGARRLIIGSTISWAVFTALTPFVSSLGMLGGIRAGLGAGEAALFPAQTSFVARFLPRNMISRIQAFNQSAIALGPLIATPFAAWIMTKWGWQNVFYVLAVMTIGWTVLWTLMTKGLRGQVTPKAGSGQEQANEKKPAAIFEKPFRSVEVWGASVIWFSVCVVFYFFLMWLPTYFIKARGLSVQDMAIFSTIPWACLFVAMNVMGYLVDWVKNNLKHNIFWRRMILAGGLAWTAVFVFLMQGATTAGTAVIYLCVAFAGLATSWPVAWALPIDYAGPKAGVVAGFMNSWGQVAGITTPLIIGYLIAGGQWGNAFYYAAAAAIGGTLVISFTSKYSTGVAEGEEDRERVLAPQS
jgi:ACS family glucarate transporter-like MFS transporter